MENYKLELTGFIKSKYLDMNTEIQNMESKLKEICNDGRYNQSYMQRALREMNNNIKELNANTRKEIQNHLGKTAQKVTPIMKKLIDSEKVSFKLEKKVKIFTVTNQG